MPEIYIYIMLRGHSMEILIFWDFHISRMSAACARVGIGAKI